MKSFWELESFGIPATDWSLYDEFCDTIRFHEGRYEVQLPWKTPRQELPNNYALSLNRLTGLLYRLRHNPDVLHEYDAVIKGQLAQDRGACGGPIRHSWSLLPPSPRSHPPRQGNHEASCSV